KELDGKLRDSFFLKAQGRIYAQFIDQNQRVYDPLLLELSEKVLKGDHEKVKILGGLAVRDPKFMVKAAITEFKGDKVAEGEWRRSIASIQQLQARHPSYLLGVNSESLEISRWFSYIFMH